jgi:hypothetical protein
MSRLSRVLGALIALGVVTSIAVGGCHPTAEERIGPGAHALSRRAAAKVLSSYAARAQELALPRDAGRIAGVQSGPMASITSGRLKINGFFDGDRASAARPGPYAHASFWIPGHPGAVPWFVASASRTGAAGRDLVLFARTSTHAAYTAEYLINVPADANLPKVRGGGDRVNTIDPADGHLAVRPDALATAHADIEQYGPSTAAAASFEPSVWTTAVHTTMTDDSRTARAAGFAYLRTYHDSGFPVYGLRTADGGALVWYAVTDELSVSQRDPSIARAPLKLTRSLAGVVGVRKVRRQFQAVSVRQYLAYVPPRGRGKVRVLASAGGPVGGVGR